MKFPIWFRSITKRNFVMSSSTIKKPTVQQPQWHKPQDKTEGKSILKIYNSLTRTKNEFIPIKPGHITWYCCGPTVYDHSHMGHARNYVSTDINRRILQDYFGYNVKFVQNVTDIDDKIIIAARQQYLFEQKIINQYKEINPQLLQVSKEYLSTYISKNLPQFTSENIESEFLTWTNSIPNVSEISKENPKFPMYLKAAKVAYEAIYNSSSSLSIEDFLEKIQDVAKPHLDKEFGSTVTDPSIFRKLPYFWENKFNIDMGRLNVLPPSVTTRVSEYIPEIIAFVDKIIQNGFAYQTSDGSVYFDTVKFENDPNHDYAKLQPWNKGDLSLINDGEGSLTVGDSKKSPSDFALWKASKPGEPSWSSKWGEGRPGWHIECSVMASDITGEVMDIHSGGIDLCFPHHDNELAQSEAYFDNKQWVNYFMHNGHLHIQGQKMSKSLKNFITIEEALNDYTSRQLRLVFALSPWDKPLDFKDSLISEVKSVESTFSKFFTTVRALNNDYKHKIAEGGFVSKKVSTVEKQLYDDLTKAQIEVDIAFNDNLSSGQAIRSIQELIGKSNSYIQQAAAGSHELRIEVILEVTSWIVKILNILGFEVRSDKLGWNDTSSSSGEDGGSVEDIALPYVKALSQFRDVVRNLAINKSESNTILQACDTIRSDLIKLNVSLDDRPNGIALVKFLNAQEKEDLIQQQEAKIKAAEEKERKKKEQAAANAKKEAERLEKMKINPADMFKDKSLYSEWDESGLPTKDINGEEISKSMTKKLTKQHQQQQKLYQEYLKLTAQ
ncbi:tRNA synthetases class I (C) catalytic domain-containing protein [Scheffersomyces amazonensis]|uniref:tRNA synthetases class I (C) catalytic domain-containing protein n=1 Tax=Scheffersomyces amazonensis TaxID=1078765 RepID=UPI00315DFB0C